MKTMKIGQADVQASQVVLGCMRMATLSTEEVARVLSTSIDCGVNFFDHADIYGAGQSEIVFAKGLQHANISRDAIYLQSKCGIRKGFFDFSKEHIIHSVEGILSRLQTDYLDFLLLHRPDALMEPEEVAEAFHSLHQSGKVRYFGVSNHNPYQIQLLQRHLDVPIVANQLQFGPAHTPMIDAGLNVNMKNEAGIVRDEGVLDFCRLENITVQPWSPFQVDLSQGLFKDHPDYQTLTETLARFAQEKVATVEGMVIAWLLRHPAAMQPIIGSMNLERIQAMCAGAQISLTREEWYEIYRSAGNVLP
ncbi:MAG: aldo/keto reductase [Aerococcaceae bacterium]|nr:aldo/keto reductase [Aerococcaceae bacterium]